MSKRDTKMLRFFSLMISFISNKNKKSIICGHPASDTFLLPHIQRNSDYSPSISSNSA